MKVLRVLPGSVKEAGGQWYYSVVYVCVGTTTSSWGAISYSSASAAKQAMRERVARERKRHCV